MPNRTSPTGPAGRKRLWLGHYGNRLIMLGAVLCIADLFIHGLLGDALGLAFWGIFVLGTLGAVLEDYHDRHLCYHCFHESPITKDLEDVLRRHDRTLELYHSWLADNAALAGLIVIATVTVSGLFPSHQPLLAFFQQPWLQTSALLAALCWLTYHAYVQLIHRRYAQWCPYCDDDDGPDDDDDLIEPSPKPTGHHQHLR